MTQRAREISVVMSDGLFQYSILPFGTKSAPATFQKEINNVKKNI